MPRVTFPKKEKLCGEIRIGKLFVEGKAFLVYPLRIVYKISEETNDDPVKILISVPKKKIKLATNRNRIKRLIRESYRLNKQDLLSSISDKNLSLQLAITYVADKELDFSYIQGKVKSSLSKIDNALNDNKT